MQGLVNFSDQIALLIAVFLPAFLYCNAIGWFIFGAWGLWQMAQPHNPFRGRPWVPFVSIVLSGVAATFDSLLTRANVSGGGDVQVGLSSDLTSYTSQSTTSLMGDSPADAINNTVAVFYLFFACFGAASAFFALSSWRAAVNGNTNRSRMGCGIQFVFGVMLINIKTIVAWLVSNWTT